MRLWRLAPRRMRPLRRQRPRSGRESEFRAWWRTDNRSRSNRDRCCSLDISRQIRGCHLRVERIGKTTLDRVLIVQHGDHCHADPADDQWHDHDGDKELDEGEACLLATGEQCRAITEETSALSSDGSSPGRSCPRLRFLCAPTIHARAQCSYGQVSLSGSKSNGG